MAETVKKKSFETTKDKGQRIICAGRRHHERSSRRSVISVEHVAEGSCLASSDDHILSGSRATDTGDSCDDKEDRSKQNGGSDDDLAIQ